MVIEPLVEGEVFVGVRQMIKSLFTYGIPTCIFAVFIAIFFSDKIRFSLHKNVMAVLICVLSAVLAGHAAEQHPLTSSFSWVFSLTAFCTFLPLLGYIFNGGSIRVLRSEALATVSAFRRAKHDLLAEYSYEEAAKELGISLEELKALSREKQINRTEYKTDE